jgi:uncharacterized protein (DUF983 family)
MPDRRENTWKTPPGMQPHTSAYHDGEQECSGSGNAHEAAFPAVAARVRLGTVLDRSLHLRCPVCGKGPMFRNWMAMYKRCSCCGLWFERDSGYFLGSIYVNYAVTTVIAALCYFLPMLWLRRSPGWLLIPIVGFCIVFPLFFFRFARALWLGLDHYMSPLDVSERPPHER